MSPSCERKAFIWKEKVRTAWDYAMCSRSERDSDVLENCVGFCTGKSAPKIMG